jgi:drug/metabolite transporter (DMT)-like permease
MLVAQALFAAMALGARFVGRDVPWQEVAAARMLVAVVLTWSIARARGASLAIVDQKLAWLRTIFGTLSAAGTFYVYARPLLPLGDAVTVLSSSPIFVALLAWPMLGERVSRRVAAAIGVGFLGIAAVAQPSFQASPGIIGLCVLTALASAFAMAFLRRMGPGESPEAIVFHFMAFGAAALTVATIPVWHTPDLRTAFWLLFTGLTGGLAQLALTRAYSLDDAARVSAVTYSSVVFVRVLALPVFGEVPNAAQLAGSALVIAAGWLLARPRRRAAPRP